MQDEKYLLAFDPGGSDATWAFSLSCLRRLPYNQFTYAVLEAGKVPVFEDLASPDFTRLENFLCTLNGKWDFKKHGCSFVAERFVGRGITGRLSEYIPFALGVWSSFWRQHGYGSVSLIMAAQWKRPLSKLNASYDLQGSWFSNWWEHYFHPWMPVMEQKNKKHGVHIQDACAIGWWAWAFKKRIWQDDPKLSLPNVFSPE